MIVRHALQLSLRHSLQRLMLYVLCSGAWCTKTLPHPLSCYIYQLCLLASLFTVRERKTSRCASLFMYTHRSCTKSGNVDVMQHPEHCFYGMQLIKMAFMCAEGYVMEGAYRCRHCYICMAWHAMILLTVVNN